MGQEYKVTINSYCEPESFETEANIVTCGCSGDESGVVRCAPVSPPRSPKPFIKCISVDGVEIGWERAKEYGSAYLSVSKHLTW